ncbi:5'-methylthioadenosine/S-adenosylhomocysteine nucleosidase [Siminovitchia acidinfaciens]|uniref:5'-methylthioadenosine/S-adenosylhomocysteine nucleosidase n=1 Tax=Siminovitchia acidinfaciens TaxID=2321395 RepID=A0A429XYS4_9BACI|nr:5'-methylthioadenosine/S-adenosylhomocysteine nucleosidase [Siminovitchia acidinfaciens]RST73897.1 5'-methylthioadenosine/S-adenosylhomocysteine nucleosidase [Siminovitchia acidinfaciens]
MKIAVIGAMEEEVELLREKMDVHNIEVIAQCEYIIGTLHDKKVILSRSGIGKVNAAMATAILLEKYKPDAVINTGSAGGYNPELRIGDLVISSEVRHHDVDVTAFNYEYGQVPQLPAAFKADEAMIEIAESVARTVGEVKAVKGLIATGDTFMSDPVKVEFVREKFPHIQAVEMEGAAIAQVAYQFDIPFVIIRSLSDIAGQKSEISFDKFIEKASVNSANLVMDMIKKLER